MNIKQSFSSLLSYSSVIRLAAATLVVLIGLTWNSPAFCDEIHDAVQKGDLAKVKVLLKDNPDLVSSKGLFGRTPLHVAAAHDNRDAVELLLASGADVNALNDYGQTPLHIAASNGYKDMAELLLAHGADVNARAFGGSTPLYQAAASGQKDIVELLLAHGAEVNARNDFSLTPLYIAESNGHKGVAELLRVKGAQ